ncbi:MAG: hypothetical protein Q7U44_05680, partial [Desulfuromonadales bacterium]|nr:hypothetical protein [Desulfuromonadales bacterium]
RLISEAVKDQRSNGMQLKEIRRSIKHQLKKKQEEYFTKYMEHFLLIDLYPDLRPRFDLRFIDVINNVKLVSK